MRWNYSSIPNLQQLYRWSSRMGKQFHPTLYNDCNYLSMLGLKLNRVSKRGPSWFSHIRQGYFTGIWQWASCQIGKFARRACAGNAGTFSPPPRVSDPDMQHDTYGTHVPWCMPGSLTSGFLWSRWQGKRYTGISGACATSILRIW